jgi:uncharacterized RDD family membrane protein YckC
MEDIIQDDDFQETEQIAKTEEVSQEGQIISATFSERLVAYFIDTVPFLLFYFASMYFMVFVKAYPYTMKMDLYCRFIWFGVYLAYLTIFLSGGRNTLGKHLIGLRVYSEDGVTALNAPKAAIRAIGYSISSVILYLGFIMAAFNKEGRALHDYMAKSVVVREREKSDLVIGMQFVFSIAIIILFAFFAFYGFFFAPSREDRVSVIMAKRTLRRMAYLEEIHKKKFGYYAHDIRRLAILSGNVKAFTDELSTAFDVDMGLEIGVGKDRFSITAHAKDKKRSAVRLSGP